MVSKFFARNRFKEKRYQKLLKPYRFKEKVVPEFFARNRFKEKRYQNLLAPYRF